MSPDPGTLADSGHLVPTPSLKPILAAPGPQGSFSPQGSLNLPWRADPTLHFRHMNHHGLPTTVSLCTWLHYSRHSRLEDEAANIYLVGFRNVPQIHLQGHWIGQLQFLFILPHSLQSSPLLTGSHYTARLTQSGPCSESFPSQEEPPSHSLQNQRPSCSGNNEIRFEMQIKPPRVIISHRSEWPSSKNLQTINAGGSVEKR